MSLVFSDTSSTGAGLLQMYELEIGANLGDVSGNATKLRVFTAATRAAFDRFLQLAITADGTRQFDDTNQTDYPIILINLVASQRDYFFSSDGTSNLILDIYKVFIANSAGIYSEIEPVDVNSGYEDGRSYTSPSGSLGSSGLTGFTDGRNATGTPSRYDVIGNGIFLDPIPSYAYTSGLKIYINREPSYFATTDTTKKPGVPGLFHSYFYLKPAQDYARRFLSTSKYQKITLEVNAMEEEIRTYFGERARDTHIRLNVAMEDMR